MHSLREVRRFHFPLSRFHKWNFKAAYCSACQRENSHNSFECSQGKIFLILMQAFVYGKNEEKERKTNMWVIKFHVGFHGDTVFPLFAADALLMENIFPSLNVTCTYEFNPYFKRLKEGSFNLSFSLSLIRSTWAIFSISLVCICIIFQIRFVFISKIMCVLMYVLGTPQQLYVVIRRLTKSERSLLSIKIYVLRALVYLHRRLVKKLAV